MFALKRKGTEVVMAITIQIPDCSDYDFSFSFDCKDDVYAALLAEKLRKQLYDSISRAKANAYDRGYSDGRGKQKKETYFSGGLIIAR